MALTDKLRDLDQRVLPGTRGPEEDAETYLRRVASSRAITPAQAGDVMAALRQYLGVGPETEGSESDEGEEDESGSEEPEGAENDGGPKDEGEKDDES